MVQLTDNKEQKLPFMAIYQNKKSMKLKTIFFIFIITFITLFVFILSNNKKSQTITTSAATPPIITPIQVETVSVMDSPEGSKTLTIDGSLFVSSNPDGQKINIFKKEEIGALKLEIPYNTWSPDNVYIFLKLKTSPVDDYLVFQSSGDLFPNNLPYVSIQELFKINVPDYTIEDVTGWAAPNLLIVNTKANESDEKVSFWFDVPSQSFIQLGTYFK